MMTMLEMDDGSSLIQYIIMNKDLDMSKGKACAQASHASVASFVVGNNIDILNQWMGSDFTKIVLGASEKEMIKFIDVFERENISYFVVYDNGKTELSGSNMTAIGLTPDYKYKISPYVKKLSLYK